IDAAADRWREDLVELGGASTLSDLTLLGEAIIDLTAAHPSGIAQLYAGRTTRLSNLIREGDALVTARRSARTVSARTDDLAQRYGVAPTYLAVGVATWTEGGAGHSAAPAPAAPPTPSTTTHPPSPESDGEPLLRRPRTVRAPVLLR